MMALEGIPSKTNTEIKRIRLKRMRFCMIPIMNN